MGVGGRGTRVWTSPSRIHWAAGTLRWGSTASQSSVPMVGSGGWLAPSGEHGPPGRLGQDVEPPVGSSAGWHQPAGGAVVICRCWGKKLDPRTTEVPPGRLAPSVSPGHASWSLALGPAAHYRPRDKKVWDFLSCCQCQVELSPVICHLSAWGPEARRKVPAPSPKQLWLSFSALGEDATGRVSLAPHPLPKMPFWKPAKISSWNKWATLSPHLPKRAAWSSSPRQPPHPPRAHVYTPSTAPSPGCQQDALLLRGCTGLLEPP